MAKLLTKNGVGIVKAFLRNLLIAGVFVLVAGGARAQPAVVWTFSGVPLDAIFSPPTTPGGLPAFQETSSGGIQAGGTMTFDAAGNLLDFNFTTDGTPSEFGFNYNSTSASYLAPGDPLNTQMTSSWVFIGGDQGVSHVLALGFDNPINVPWGPGAANVVGIVPGNTLESFSESGNEYDGDFRMLSDTTMSGLMGTAVQVPEPASMALLGVGLLGLAIAGRRRNRNLGSA